MKKGFTLMEILVVVAVLVILAVTVLLILDPIKLSQQARDATRVSDMNTLNKAISLYYSDAMGNPSTMFMGTSSVIYVSVPDPTATSTNQCTGLGLPTPPSGYTYQCSASSIYLNVNGTGWIPINFNSYLSGKGGSPISKLPVDPVNTTSTNLYYTYETDGIGGYKVTAFFESAKYAPQMASDGGNDPELYEKGSNLALTSGRGLIGFWPLNEGTGATTAYDQSGNSNNGTWNGTPSGTSGYYSAGPAGNYAGYFNASNNWVAVTDPGSLHPSVISMSLWFDTQGTGNVYLLYKGGGLGTGTGYNAYIYSGNDPACWFYDGSGNLQDLRMSGSVSSNAWYHLVCTYDNTSLKMYINGALNNSLSASGFSTNNQALNIGYLFGGGISDVRIYDRALTAAEIKEMYNTGQ